MDDDGWGVIIFIAVLGFGGWWLYDNYEITEKNEPPPVETAQTIPPVRPIAPFEITKHPDGSVYTLDPETVKVVGKTRSAWITMDHSLDKTVTARESKELIWVDCSTGATKSLSLIQYDPEGKVIFSSSTEPDDASVIYYPPNTVGAAAPSHICRDVFADPVK